MREGKKYVDINLRKIHNQLSRNVCTCKCYSPFRICGEEDHRMQHCLVCPLLHIQFSSMDFAVFNENAKDYVQKWSYSQPASKTRKEEEENCLG